MKNFTNKIYADLILFHKDGNHFCKEIAEMNDDLQYGDYDWVNEDFLDNPREINDWADYKMRYKDYADEYMVIAHAQQDTTNYTFLVRKF